MRKPSRHLACISRFMILIIICTVPPYVFGQNNSVDWVVGDAFIGIGNGSYQIWHSANPMASNPTYSLVQTINDGTANGGATNGGATAGCGFDLGYRFLGTNFTNALVDRYAIDNGNNNLSIVEQISHGNSPGTSTQSVAVDAGKNLYVGYAGGASAGFGTIEQWSKDTNPSSATFGHYTFVQAFSVPVDNTSGPGWIDLAKDGVTVFYTSQGRTIRTFNTATLTSAIFADLSNAPGTLFGIRILPPGDGSAGVVVADQTNVKVVTPAGVAQKINFGNNNNLQALSLDPLISTALWVGDASTNNFVRFDLATNQKVSLNTRTGTLGGICLEGGFNAAELNGQTLNTQTFALVPPTQNNPTSNTFSFTTLTGSTFTATFANLKNKLTATLRDSVVDASVALSDPTVFSFNLGNPSFGISTIPGNMICDQRATTAQGFPGKCEIFELEANPNSGYSVTNTQITPPSGITETALDNLRLLRNHGEDITTDPDLVGTRTNCVYTSNVQTSNPAFEICGNSFSSPANGQSFTKNQTSTISFKFKVSPFATCPNGQSPTFLQPLLLIVQQQPAVGGVTPSPVPMQVIVAGNSGGPPIFTLSGNTWQLQVKTSDLPAGFTYVASMIDLTGTVPSINVTFSLN
jgi:hypothetical protein